MADTPNFIPSEGVRIWINPTLPVPVASGDEAGEITLASFATLETGLLELEWHTGFTTLDTTRPERRKEFLDKGNALIAGIETHSSFTLQVTKQRDDASAQSAYDAILAAYDAQVPMTMKALYSDLSGRWATFNLTGAVELAPVGESLVLDIGIAVATVFKIAKPTS